MIIEGMTSTLIRNEFNAGLKGLKYRVEEVARKARKNLGSAPCRTVVFNHTDPRKNRWSAYISSDKKGFSFIPCLEYHNQKGKLRFILKAGDPGILQIFTGHFLRRYKERSGLEGFSGKVTDDFFVFAKDNSLHTPAKFRNNIVQVEFPHGVGLGYSYGDAVYYIKTFVSHEMLNGYQEELSLSIREELDLEP